MNKLHEKENKQTVHSILISSLCMTFCLLQPTLDLLMTVDIDNKNMQVAYASIHRLSNVPQYHSAQHNCFNYTFVISINCPVDALEDCVSRIHGNTPLGKCMTLWPGT